MKKTEVVIIVLLVIALVFSAVSVMMNFSSEYKEVSTENLQGEIIENSGNINLIVEPGAGNEV